LNGRIRIISQNPPFDVVTKGEGKLNLFVTDNQLVKDGEVLGFIGDQDVYNEFRSMSHLIAQLEFEVGERRIKIEVNIPHYSTVSEFQTEFLILKKQGVILNDAIDSGPFQRKGKVLQDRLQIVELINKNLSEMDSLIWEELIIQENFYRTDSLLFDNNSGTLNELSNSKSNYLQTSRASRNSKIALLSNKLEIVRLNEELTNLRKTYNDNVEAAWWKFIEELNNFSKVINEWEKKYLLKSSVEGKVLLSTFVRENQYVNIGQEIVTIIPEKTGLNTYLELPVNGAGKVAKGQVVIIDLDSYPSSEFGNIEGIVEFVSTLPEDDHYYLSVHIPAKAFEELNPAIKFNTDMRGNARIIVSDVRLFYSLIPKLFR
jgi:HlyD family secretion protein